MSFTSAFQTALRIFWSPTIWVFNQPANLWMRWQKRPWQTASGEDVGRSNERAKESSPAPQGNLKVEQEKRSALDQCALARRIEATPSDALIRDV